MKRVERVSGLLGIGTVALGMMAIATSCLRVSDQHCMFNGGDDACDGMYCVAAVEEGSSVLASTSADGCMDGLPPLDDDGAVHVQYGLIESQAELDELLMRKGVDPACPDMTELLDEIRPDLASREKVRRAVAALTLEQSELIQKLNDAINLGIERCREGQTTGSTTLVDETTTTGETEGMSSSTTDDLPCTSDDMCSGDTPFCSLDTGECVPCDGMPDPNAACASLEMGTPVCLGKCVQCTAELPDACTGVPPLCDADTNICQPCTAHDQCGEAACNLFTGACLPNDDGSVAHVGPGQRFTTLAAAVNTFGDGTEGTIVVHDGSYDESITVNGGRVLAFLAADIGPTIDPPVWTRSSGNSSQLTVTADSTVLMDGMQLSTNISGVVPGLNVGDGRAWVDRSRVIANLGGGIAAQTGTVLTLRNCFVGGDVSDRNALEVNGAAANVVYTTLAAGFGAATALACDGTAAVNIHNSLLVSRSDDPEVACDDASIEHSAAELALRGTNTDLSDMNTNWFTSYGTGDFHLAAMHPAAIDAAAQRQPGDPSTDIDGDARPAEGSPDYAGADIP